VIRRDVECVEIVRVGFDLGAEDDGEAMPGEVARHVDRDPADGVDRA